MSKDDLTNPDDGPRLTTDVLVWAYEHGVFPMADGADGPIHWFSPDPRAVLPLERFHASRSLRRRVRSGAFHITFDQCFTQVMRCCAEPRATQRDTWISPRMVDIYSALHEAGLAHSIEAWSEHACRQLAGGLYGVSLGGAFFGESMFSRATDASKVCLFHLVEHLRRQGYVLLDTQFSTPHLEQFGIIEISRGQYLERLQEALALRVSWSAHQQNDR